jgi:hypothetical protein
LQIEWKITGLKTSVVPAPGTVVEASYSARIFDPADEGAASAEMHGSVPIEKQPKPRVPVGPQPAPEPDAPFVAVGDLTEAMVLAWLWEGPVGKEATETELRRRVGGAATSLPWAPPVEDPSPA